MLEEVARRDGRVSTLDHLPGAAAYREPTSASWTGHPARRNGQRAVLSWSLRGEGQMIEDLLRRARLNELPTLRIDPSVDVSTRRPRCFIAMPFGKKTDPQRRIEVDSDLVYSKVLIPALEHAQLDYRRADEEIDSGIVLESMIEWLAHADLVIGDLGTGNFNVGWELGLRHLLRPSQTLLIGPAGTTAPFDLAAMRLRYRQDERSVSDDAAIEAWGALAPYLARAGEALGNDSPSPPSWTFGTGARWSGAV